MALNGQNIRKTKIPPTPFISPVLVQTDLVAEGLVTQLTGERSVYSYETKVLYFLSFSKNEYFSYEGYSYFGL